MEGQKVPSGPGETHLNPNGNQPPSRSLQHGTKSPGEVHVKHELEQLRIWAGNRLRSGGVPGWFWQRHVNLIDAVDSILHDMAMLDAQPAEIERRTSNHLRLVRDAAAQALTELSLEVTEPAQYQFRTQSVRGRARNLH